MASPVYASPVLLELIMRAKYGKDYLPRLKRVADEIPPGSTVVDLACGGCEIYRHFLRDKPVDYLGIEINEKMARTMKNKGFNVLQGDVRNFVIPRCDVIIFLAGLYQMPDQAESILNRCKEKAKKVILLEPVENLAKNSSTTLSSFAGWVTDFGEGPVTFRYSEQEVSELWTRVGVSEIERMGADLLGIWNLESEPTS